MPGWKCDIRGIRNYNELPAECRAYIEEIEEGNRRSDHDGFQWTGTG